MRAKQIIFAGTKSILVCDGKCHKAWGINSRAIDADGQWVLDDKLGRAPDDPGTGEGGQHKPRCEEDMLNRWCARECERSIIVEPGKSFSLPYYGGD